MFYLKKILLTSTGLENKMVAEKFIALVPKPIKELKILFVPTASRTDDEKVFVRKSLNELLSVGINKDNIVWFDADDVSTYFNDSEFDCIYVCGGNAFYLLKKLKENNYFSRIKEFVNKGLFYVGISAGSVIATSDINYILCMDENDCKLDDTAGLSFLSSALIPHYNEEFSDTVSLLMNNGKEVVTISDNQAVVILGEKIEKIG